MIKSLSSSAIHRICSSQVITTLATAVKELVENSVDAGATKIDILLKNYGKESITVTDNGNGIDPKDFELIATKHATSKLAQFEDLESLQSFGFRGEALSSLSAICGSHLIIKTKQKISSNVFGHELKYDNEGKLISNKKIAFGKANGTSIKISKLFSTLPVRYKDFTKNFKKEYGKLMQVMQSYAIMQTKIHIICRNDNKIVLNTKCQNHSRSRSVRSNLGNIFGWKLVEKLRQIDNECLDGIDFKVRLDGFVSNELMENGRSKQDIQFFYVNKRPVDVPKIQKLINQIYRSNINRHKYPMIVLNIGLLTNKYDINIDPNKRSVFIQNEGALLGKLNDFFIKLYEQNNMSFTVKSLDSFITISDNQKKRKHEREEYKEPPTKIRRCSEQKKVHQSPKGLSNHVHSSKAPSLSSEISMKPRNESPKE